METYLEKKSLLEDQIKSLRDLESKLASMDISRRKSEENLHRQEEKNRLLVHELSSLTDKFKAKEGELSKANSDLQRNAIALAATNKTLEQEIARLKQSATDELAKNATDLNNQIEKHKEIGQKLVLQLNSEKANHKQALTDLGEANRQIKALQTLNESLKDNLRADETEVGHLRSQIANLENQMTDRDLKIKSTTFENRNLSSEVDKLRKDLDKALQQVEGLVQLESQNKDLIKSLRTEAANYKGSLDLVSKQLESTKVDNNRLAQASSRLKSTIEKKDVEIEELNAAQKALSVQIRELTRPKNIDRQSSNGNDKRIAELEESNRRLREAEGLTRKRLDEARTRINDLESSARSLEDEYRGKLRDKERQVKALSAQVSKLKAEWVTDLRRKDQVSSQDIGDLRRQYEHTIYDLKGELANLKENSVKQLNEAVGKVAEDHQLEISKYRQQISALKQQAKEKTDCLASQIDQLVGKIGSDPSAKIDPTKIEEAFRLKFEGQRAEVEALYENKIDKLLEEKVDLQKQLTFANKEILRMTEYCEDLKELLLGDIGTPSETSSRRGSVYSTASKNREVSDFPMEDLGRSQLGPVNAKQVGLGRGSLKTTSGYHFDRPTITRTPLSKQSPEVTNFAAYQERGMTGDSVSEAGQHLDQVIERISTDTGIRKITRVVHESTPQKEFDIGDSHEDHVFDEQNRGLEIRGERSDSPQLSSDMKGSLPNMRGYQNTVLGKNYPLPNLTHRSNIVSPDQRKIIASDFSGQDSNHEAQRDMSDESTKNRAYLSKYRHNPEEGRDHISSHNVRMSPLRYDHMGPSPSRASGWQVKEKPAYLQTLTTLRKVRILNNSLHHILSSHKLKAFHSILQANIRRLRGWGEAGNRVKGRLLYMLKSRYADVGVRRSFLKWAVISKPDFLRRCVTKLALSAKLDEHTVFWRFRKVIEKRIRTRISDTAKLTRCMLASNMIHYLFKRVHTVRKIEAFNWIRPKIVGKGSRVLSKLLVIKGAKVYLDKIKALSKLRHFSHKKSLAVSALTSASEAKLVQAFDVLKMNSEALKQGDLKAQEAEDALLMAKALKSAVGKSVDSFFSKDNLLGKESRTHSVVKFLSKAKIGLASQALDLLINHWKSTSEATSKRRRAVLRLVNSMKAKNAQRLLDAYRVLGNKTKENEFNCALGAIKSSTLAEKRLKTSRNSLQRLQLCALSKTKAAFSVLLDNQRQDKIEEYKALAMKTKEGNMKARLVSKLLLAFRLKQNAAHTELNQHSKAVKNSEAYKNKVINRMLVGLAHGSSAKQVSALRAVRSLNTEIATREARKRELQRRHEIVKTRLLNSLSKGSKAKVRDCFFQLIELSRRHRDIEDSRQNLMSRLVSKLANASQVKQRIAMGQLKTRILEDMIDTSQNQLKDQRKNFVILKASSRLVNGNTNKVRNALKKLVDHKDKAKLDADTQNSLQNRCFNKILKAQGRKVASALEVLADHNRALSNEQDAANTIELLKRAKLQKLFRFLLRANSNKQENAFNILQAFKNDELRRTQIAKKLQRALLNKLDSALHLKERVAFAALSLNRLEGMEEDARLAWVVSKKNGLVKAFSVQLGWSCSKMMHNALRKLRINNAEQSLRDYRTSKAVTMFVLRLSQSMSGKFNKAFLVLRRANDSAKNQNRTANLLKTAIISRLGQAFNRKLASALGKLQSNMTTLINAESKQSKKLVVGLHRMGNALHTKLRIAMNSLIQHSISSNALDAENTIKKKRDENLIHKLLHKLCRNFDQKLGQSLRRMVINKVSQSGLEDSKLTRTKLMLARFVSSCTGKQARALEILQDHSYSAYSRDSRRSLGVIYLMNRLALKQRDAYSKLQQHSDAHKNYFDAIEKSRHAIISQVSSRLTSGKQDNLRKCVQLMKSFAQEQRRRQEVKTKAFSKLGSSLRQKLKESMFQLKSYHIYRLGESKLSITLMENLIEREMLLKRRMCKRLVTALRQSCAQTIRQLKYMNIDYKDYKNKESQAVRTLLSRASLSEAYNKRFILNKMKNHSKVLREYREYIFKMGSRIVNKLAQARTGVLYQAYFTLLRHKLTSDEKVKTIKSQLSVLFSTLAKAQSSKVDQALGKAKKFNADLHSQQRRIAFAKVKIAQSVVRGEVGKISQAFNSLKKLNFARSNDAMVRNFTLSKIVRRVETANLMKVTEAFGKLAQHKTVGDSAGFKKLLFSKLLVRTLLGNFKTMAKRALDHLRLYNSQEEALERNKRKKEAILVSKLVSSQGTKLRKVFSTLVTDFEENQRRGQRENYIKRRAIEKLASNFKGITSRGYYKLKELSLLRSGNSTKRHFVLSHFVSRLVTASESKQRESLDQLAMFSIGERARADSKRRVIQRLVRNMEVMSSQTLARLQLNQVFGKLQKKTQRLKLTAVVAKAQGNILKEAYRKLLKNARDRSRLVSIIEKYDAKLRSQASYSALSKLNLLCTMEKKKMIMSRVITLMTKLHENVTASSREAFKRLKDQVSAPKTKGLRMYSVLSKLANLRQSYTLQKIKNRSEIAGVDMRKQAIRKLLKTLIGLATSRRNSVFTEIKQNFHSDNRWFRKVVSLWTQKSKLNAQKAFWRIKDQKVLGISSVETSKAVKLKSLVGIFHKIELRTMASVFSAVQYSSAFKSWQFSQLGLPPKSELDGIPEEAALATEDATMVQDTNESDIQPANFTSSLYIDQTKDY